MRKRLRLRSRFRFTLFLTFVIVMIWVGGRYYFSNTSIDQDNNIFIKDSGIIPTKQGTITMVSIDATTDLPIKNTEYTITDLESSKVVQRLITDENGIAISRLLDYGTSYEIEQSNIIKPYKLSNEGHYIEINNENHEIIIRSHWLEFVKAIQPTDDGSVEITELYIPVESVMQNPELPNGCEITSLTAVLNSYGYEVSKTEMADSYLPKQPFTRINGKLYGANPYEAYAGDPRDVRGGFFSYAPPIVEAANRYFEVVGGDYTPHDISLSAREEIIDYMNHGVPIVIWVPIDLQKPRINYGWYFHESEEYFDAPVNLHCLVLNGYEDGRVHVMDPLKGQIIYDADAFFEGYNALGSHAMVVVEN